MLRTSWRARSWGVIARSVGIVVLGSGLAVAEGAPDEVPAEDEEIRFTDNLFLDAQGGFEEYPLDDGTQAFGSVGFNWGVPLTRPRGGPVFGLQGGADLKF